MKQTLGSNKQLINSTNIGKTRGTFIGKNKNATPNAPKRTSALTNTVGKNNNILVTSINTSDIIIQDVSDVNKFTVYEKANFLVPSRYEIKFILGKGSYGTVCSAIDNKDHVQPVPLAIKKVTNIFTREILLKRAIRELKFMRYFKGHKNIINLIDLEIVTVMPYDGLYCFQELVDYDLARVIHSSVQFSEFHIKKFFYQILCGLKYIHSADVIHRDLKPGNILCTIQGTLKICDFGLARGVAPKYFPDNSSEQNGNGTSYALKTRHITNYVATRWYRAPELMLSNKKYTKAIDLWACGCILAEFYGRKPIFIGNDQMHQISEIVKVLGTPNKDIIIKYGSHVAWEIFCPPKPQYRKVPWSNIYSYAQPDGLDLIDKLLKWDPNARLTVEEAIEHEFLQDFRDKSEEPVCSKGAFNFAYEYEHMSLTALKQYLFEEVCNFKKEMKGIGKNAIYK
ncbi:related to Sporulation-specific mitogen-activated protein kinase SMK1 [Saccharomycodes ludwigii]|uniref:Related to Sporulation-specific mitogen-activated protein kinase SMK1 n=1 Tax=Saccharomycodes ludwigii TaxID=36035 RepID=A0A376B526_9ASCO|nr:related to Sporulation-specific mitogen-activated protein kinase SMK1 [Saccharomycodes ludwigii]